ncbi:hypothetical protein MJG53_008632 [Ovis ammon polii x Ovis aries]|uniref:Uncharacterized protein n=1 Tax=Ovis ammon polii x Ovis aries TaxID=2918886 RepID=A0ACB9V1C9_9CETA|nr:hypothetical protein MJG53_008632 [Ovis ammon polii x Ovis aries]
MNMGEETMTQMFTGPSHLVIENEMRGSFGDCSSASLGSCKNLKGPPRRKIEDIITKMQDDKTGGVPVRTVKSFLSKIPSVVTGTDIVQWLMKNLSIEDPVEAIHLGSLIAAQGYVFPISDHVLTMKDDGTFYRFQAPYFWPSNCWEPENTDYAIYLCKRTMQNKARLELADYEAVSMIIFQENLARLQRAFARKWEFIFMQAEAQVKIDRKKDKTERKILDSQERAFWDVHRPVSVYGVTEESQSQSPVHIPSQPIRKTTKEDVRKQITFLNAQIDRHCLKMSKVAESLIAYTEQYVEYDPLITPAEPSNPWISDDITLWDIEMSKEPSQQRVKRWGFSFDEILKDQVGRDQFLRFLESEFSSENLRTAEASGTMGSLRLSEDAGSLEPAQSSISEQTETRDRRFWLAVQDLKKQPLQDVARRVEEIWQEFLAPGAPSAINLDSHSYEITSQNVKDGGRYTFEDAQSGTLLTGPRGREQLALSVLRDPGASVSRRHPRREHIYKLMKSDSYARFLRSNAYQDLLLAKKKPESEQGRRTSLEKFTRSVNALLSTKQVPQGTRDGQNWALALRQDTQNLSAKMRPMQNTEWEGAYEDESMAQVSLPPTSKPSLIPPPPKFGIRAPFQGLAAVDDRVGIWKKVWQRTRSYARDPYSKGLRCCVPGTAFSPLPACSSSKKEKERKGRKEEA